MVPAAKRDAVTKTVLVHVNQPITVVFFLIGHFFENFAGIREFIEQRIGVGQVNTRIILL